MTCFWDGIKNSLENEDRELLGLKDNNIYTLINTLKEKNTITKGVKWQSKTLNDTDLQLHFDHIKNYDPNTARLGYLCSSCDAFLALLSFLLNKTFIFDCYGTEIKFEPENSSNKTYYYACNFGHFWFSHKH